MIGLAPLLLSLSLFDPMPWVYEGGLATVAWVRAEGEAAGTGFVVDVAKRHLITCRHVVGDRQSVEVFFPWRRDGVLISDRQEYLSNRETLRKLGLLVAGKVLRTSDAADLALVELPSLPASVKAVTLAGDAKVLPARPSDRLLAIGQRHDLETLWNCTTGCVRQMGRLTDGYSWRATKLAANAVSILAQLPIEEGDSGGPVFDVRGRCVGMTAALRRACPEAAVVIDAREVRAFVNSTQLEEKDLAASETDCGLSTSRIECKLRDATMWVSPNSTDWQMAAVLINGREGLYLTCARGLGPGDRVPVAFAPVAGSMSDQKVLKDPIEGGWAVAMVVARDLRRDLALLKLEGPADENSAISLSRKPCMPGAKVHTMSHPLGLEFAWVYAAGTIRQRGQISLGLQAIPSERVSGVLLQLPSQGRSLGGPIVDENCDLVGVISGREGVAGQVSYSVTVDEIRKFLDAAYHLGPARTWDGLLARCVQDYLDWRILFSAHLANLGDEARRKQSLEIALKYYEAALTIDPNSAPSILEVAATLEHLDRTADAEAILDRAIVHGCRYDPILALRVRLAHKTKTPRLARTVAQIRADLSKDPEVYRALAQIEFELGDDAKAAKVYSQFIRRSGELHDLCSDLKSQVEQTMKTNPDAHGRAADWVKRVFAQILSDDRDQQSSELPALLENAAKEPDDSKRLQIFMTFLQQRTKKK